MQLVCCYFLLTTNNISFQYLKNSKNDLIPNSPTRQNLLSKTILSFDDRSNPFGRNTVDRQKNGEIKKKGHCKTTKHSSLHPESKITKVDNSEYNNR